jgi:hypothetical protein
VPDDGGEVSKPGIFAALLLPSVIASAVVLGVMLYAGQWFFAVWALASLAVSARVTQRMWGAE